MIKVHTVRVHDASNERKTADNLLTHLENVIKELEDEWGTTVVAVVTDASGESHAARRMLGEKYPWLIVLDCHAHQVNLIVGDYFKHNPQLLTHTDNATELITWLRSKTLVLTLIRETQLLAGEKICAVIRAVLTCWTAHYLAYRRLLQLRQTLFAIIITGDAKAKAKATKMTELIKDTLFWIKMHLEPLAFAANVTQATICTVDTVLLTFGFLVMQYKSMSEPEDTEVVSAIIQSIKRRWAKCDQEIFIAAVVINPFYKTTPFSRISSLNNANIHTLLECLYTRFF
ncbi:hypothetical protein PAXINDRAFT_88772 [Paxillus involutus ATCC 200175]|uniref:DUF659 domain-containing protein n=1 Tax=Paxillus involutus ATCC 200175 TaxID=664439 RepID=A0A0C9TBR4_PAXIN|nr:hypothetical protein PAXINDRAFT_88772 [Paxillus involutus ATCC 200175]